MRAADKKSDMYSSISRISAMTVKEIRHILRDWQTLMIVIAMPLVMMFLYGYALTLDFHDLPVMIEDPAHTKAGKYFKEAIEASDMFKVIGICDQVSEPENMFKKYHIKVLFRIPSNIDRALESQAESAQINVLIDGTDPNTGTILRNIAAPFINKTIAKYMDIDIPEIVKISPRILYNPRQESSLFFIPGLMALILIMLSTLMTSLTLTREKEFGTMKQLLISPVRPFEIIAGKIFPYILLAAFDAFLILVAGRVFFGVRINGSILFLSVCTTVYIITSLALGIIFSTVANNQIQAMFMALPATMLPSMILSGFIFPLSSMPVFLRSVAYIVPATYFLELIRGIILKGASIHEQWKPLLILVGFGAIFFSVAVKRFKVRL